MARRVPWWQGVVVGLLVALALLGAKGTLLSGSSNTYRPSAPVWDASVSSAVADPSPGEPCAIITARIGDLDDVSAAPTPEEIERAFADRPACLAEWRGNTR